MDTAIDGLRTRYVSQRRAARMLGVSYRRIAQLAASGYLGVRRIPGVPDVYNVADINRLAAEAERPAHAIGA